MGLLAAVLAALAARSVTLPINSDLGLVQTLPPAYWVGMVVLNGAFVLALGSGAHHRTSQWAMATLLGALVVTHVRRRLLRLEHHPGRGGLAARRHR